MKEEKRKVGRPKLTDNNLKKNAIINNEIDKNYTYKLWMIDKNEKVTFTFDKNKDNKIRKITHNYSIDYNY